MILDTRDSVENALECNGTWRRKQRCDNVLRMGEIKGCKNNGALTFFRKIFLLIKKTINPLIIVNKGFNRESHFVLYPAAFLKGLPRT